MRCVKLPQHAAHEPAGAPSHLASMRLGWQETSQLSAASTGQQLLLLQVQAAGQRPGR